MFSKQHFEKIAKLIKNSKSESKQGFISELVNLFALDNAKFKPYKFYKASGLTMEDMNIHIERLKAQCMSVPAPIFLKL